MVASHPDYPAPRHPPGKEPKQERTTVAATPAAAKEPSSFRKTFKNVAGVAMAGTLLSTGIYSFFDSNGLWGHQASLSNQLINTASIVTAHLAVWGIATMCGGLGWQAGKYFDNDDSKIKPRALAAGVGLALIAASFSFSLGGKIYDGVHDGLAKTFNVEAPAVPTYPTPSDEPPAKPEPAPTKLDRTPNL